jgi:hypothetical protein
MIVKKGNPKNRNGLRLNFAWYHRESGDCRCRRREKDVGIFLNNVHWLSLANGNLATKAVGMIFRRLPPFFFHTSP